PSWPQDTRHFVYRTFPVDYVVEHKETRHDVDRLIVIRQVWGVGLLRRGVRAVRDAVSCVANHGGVNVSHRETHVRVRAGTVCGHGTTATTNLEHLTSKRELLSTPWKHPARQPPPWPTSAE